MQQYDAVRRAGTRSAAIDEGLRGYMNRVYGLMAVAMVISGVVAYVFGMDLKAMVQGQPTTIIPEQVLVSMYSGPIRWVIMLAPLGMVFLFGAAMRKMSDSGAQMFFWAFAALMGLSIASIFAVYTGISIAQTFFATAIAFGGLSFYGYTTKKDLSGMGTFLLMGVIGLVVASVINIFIASSALQFAISVVGVLVFAGLTAYDTQQIKNEYLDLRAMGPQGEAYVSKSAIGGALRLYLDFLNMFMFLLQFMGNRE
ncbi:Bax inhibitor-1/YccA family protein [uncultured Albimonas sp.]|uniref:Bax inhibitor-1/YccA family protein n=1 Tax=uncultured Albimonas sp. TaxID=1331701 RepID=UPI0030EC4C71